MENLKHAKRSLSFLLSTMMIFNLFTSVTYANDGDVINPEDVIEEVVPQENVEEVPEVVEQPEQEEPAKEEVQGSNANDIQYPSIAQSQSSHGVKVDVNAPEGAFEQGTSLSIKALDNVTTYVGENDGAVGFDISFKKDGQVVQPKKAVTLTFTIDSTSGLLTNADKISVYHIGNTKELCKEVSVADGEQSKVITVSASSFSPYVVMKQAKQANNSNSAVSHDLKDHIQSLEITGNPESVEDGKNVTVKFGWLIEGEVHGSSDVFTYQLPANFKIEHTTTGDITRGQNGNKIGTYTVDTSGKVTIHYNDDYNTSKQTTINYMEITGEAQYGDKSSDHQITFTWTNGSKVVVVTNPGDFTIEKTGEKEFKNDVLSKDSVVEYTVKITSELGTNGPFKINDTFTLENLGTNDSVSLDKNSFKLVNTDGKSVQINPTVDGLSFEIENVPALDANGEYTLTYKVNVHKDNYNNGKSTKIKNTVIAESGNKKHADDCEVSYTEVLTKAKGVYTSSRNAVKWDVVIRPNATNLGGFTFTDTADNPILKDDITITQWTSPTSNKKLTPEITFSNDDKTFSFTLPDNDNVYYYSLTYYTKADVKAGEQFNSQNTATLKNDKEGWVATNIATHKGIGKADIKKTYESTKVNDDGTASIYWKSSVELSGVTPEKNEYMIQDDIANPQLWRQFINSLGHSWNQWDNKVMPNGHYGIPAEIDKEIKDSLQIKILEDDKEVTYSYDEFIKKYPGKVEIRFYEVTDLGTIPQLPNNSTKKSRKFRVYIRDVKVLHVSMDYSTRFDMSMYSDGSTWRLENKLVSGSESVTVGHDFIKKLGTEGLISKQVGITSTHFVSNDYSFDYDKINGELTFRLLVTPDEDETNAYISDTLPEGFTIKDGSIRVGNYDKAKNGLSANWTNNANVSIDYSKDTNQLVVNIDKLGTDLKFKDENTVVVQYTVQIDEDFQKMKDATITHTKSSYISEKDFVNVAYHGEDGNQSDSLTTTIYRTETVLDKSGEQVKNGDALTNRVHYTVTINENQLDLVPNSDVLTLTDTLTSDALDFKLDAKSMKLYTLENGKKGKEVDPSSLHVQQPETKDDECSQTFTITIKDETAYVLEYDFVADMRDDNETEGTFENKIDLVGYTSDTAEVEVKGINVKVSSNHAGLNLVKVDSKNNSKFLTADFELAEYVNGQFKKVDDIKVSGDKGYLFDYYSTNSKLKGNTLYRVTEKNAPEGYKLDDTPFYFVIRGNIQDVVVGKIESTNLVISSEQQAKEAAKVPSDINPHYLMPNTGSYFEIENEKEDGKVVLEAKKELAGRSLKDKEFNFIVTEDGNQVSTGTNDGNGKI